MEITKIKIICASCDENYVIAYREPNEAPQFCAFCGEEVAPHTEDEVYDNEERGN